MNGPGLRALLVLVAVLVGIIVGLVAGIVSRIGGTPSPAAVLRGGAACGGTITLVVLIMSTLGAFQ
jgi:hypothetical protein